MDALRAEIREKTERLASLDTGFRVLKCDSPNERDVSFAITGVPPAKKDLFDAVGNIKADRTELDLLFEAMLAHNCLLSSAIETVTIEGHTVYSVEHGHLVACFEADLPESLIREVATRQWSPAGTPISFFIMRDSSYRDDSMAANFEQIFRHFSPDTTAEVL